jgi:hypothetical protein
LADQGRTDGNGNGDATKGNRYLIPFPAEVCTERLDKKAECVWNQNGISDHDPKECGRNDTPSGVS